jgi:hypothetical protein
MPSVKQRRHSRRKMRVRHVPRPPVELRQSWAGTLSLVLGMFALFCLVVQGILMLQENMGARGAWRMFMPWVTRGEMLACLPGTCLALLSFPFSSRRQRNAIIGLLLSVTVLAAWIWLKNWTWAL